MTPSIPDAVGTLAPSYIERASSSCHLAPAVSALLCFVLSLAMHLPWIGITPLAGTEAHRVIPAIEMVRSHNWLLPILFGRPFLTKPPLHHWLIALSQILAGQGNLFVWRLPSAIAGALLCSVVCLFAARWFGRLAGLIAGVCVVGMVALWGQSQVADIDATNTLATTLAAFCGTESLIARPARRRLWIAMTALSLAATLMAKGTAGLPILLGVWICGIRSIRQQRGPRAWMDAEVWVPWAFALLVFGTWVALAKLYLAHRGLAVNAEAARNGVKFLHPSSAWGYLKSVFFMLPQAIAFALPMSAALLFHGDLFVRHMIPPAQRPIAATLARSVLISWAVCVAVGMTNPRYTYITYLPMCPLAGVAAVAAARLRSPANALRLMVFLTTIGLAIATVVLGCVSWRGTELKPLLAASGILGVICMAWTIRRRVARFSDAWGIVPLLLILSVPFGIQRHISRTRDSGINWVNVVQDAVGKDQIVAAGEMALWKPEIFYYAKQIRLEFHPYGCVPRNVEPGRYVMLDQFELKRWQAEPGVRLEREKPLLRSGDMTYYVAWYAGRDQPTTRFSQALP